jgi:hypothetical protein
MNDNHHHCFHCGDYFDECQCDGGMGRMSIDLDEAKAIASAAIDLMASNENTDVLALQLAAVRGAVRGV